MKNKFLYIGALLLTAGLSSCDDNWERPPLVEPVATIKANTTIKELKEVFNTGANSSCIQVGTRADGEDYIISGRVISSDQSGNIFKALYIEDETSGISIRMDEYDLYQSFQFGQEVVIDVTGLYIGCYGGLMQIGWTESSGTPSRLPSAQIASNVQVNGLAYPDKIICYDTSIADLKALLSTPQAMEWQCRYVKLKDLTFKGAGSKQFAPSTSNYTSNTMQDADGNTIILYTSSYADFGKYLLPTGTGSITAILSYFSNAGWQLIINSLDDLQGFDEVVEAPEGGGESTEAPAGEGTLESPYNVAKALQIINGGSATEDKVYVKGIISKISEISTSYGNATYFISDDGSANGELEIYRGYGLGGNKFTSEDDLKVGDEVVINGVLTLYNTTPEVKTGSSIVELNGTK